MNDILIIEKAIEEVETKTLAVTEQFLEIHKIVYVDSKPKIARVDTDKEGQAIVYFNVEGERFFLAVYLNISPTISIRHVNTEPFHSVYFKASSDKLNLKELSQLTKLASTGGRNKGDKKNPGGSEVEWKLTHNNCKRLHSSLLIFSQRKYHDRWTLY